MVTKASLDVGTRKYIFYILPSGGEPYWALSSFTDCMNEDPRQNAFYAKRKHEKSWAKLHAELFPDAVVSMICVGPDGHSHAYWTEPCGSGDELLLPEPSCQVSMFITIWMWCVMSHRLGDESGHSARACVHETRAHAEVVASMYLLGKKTKSGMVDLCSCGGCRINVFLVNNQNLGWWICAHAEVVASMCFFVNN
jgi:hypothetical protein